MVSSTLVKTKEPASVWFIESWLSVEVKVAEGDPQAIFSLLRSKCREKAIPFEQLEFSFKFAKSASQSNENILVSHLKQNDVTVIIPPQEMAA